MKILNEDEIFDNYTIEFIDKFTLTFKSIINYDNEIHYSVEREIFKMYFKRDCEFSFFYFLDVLEYLSTTEQQLLRNAIMESMIVQYNNFDYGILTHQYKAFYLYISMQYKENVEVYKFETFQKYQEFINTFSDSIVFYEIV